MRLQEFDYHFELIQASTPEQFDTVHRLRYQVYCVEQGHVIPGCEATQKESDDYDDFSLASYLIHKSTGQPMATVRLILAAQTRLPMERFAILRRDERDRIWRLPRQCIGEVSRFAVSKKFRRRVAESQVIHGITPDNLFQRGNRRWYPFITIGLVKAIVQMSEQQGITHWYALMEQSLIRLLKRMGIHFTPIGPAVNHFGVRLPCITVISEMLDSIDRLDPEVCRFLTEAKPAAPVMMFDSDPR